MMLRRLRPRRFAALSFLNNSSAHSTSASISSPAAASTSHPAVKSEDSIFTAPESPWDYVFADVEPVTPPAVKLQRLRARLTDKNAGTGAASAFTSVSNRKRNENNHGHSQPESQSPGLVRRSSMVKRQRASLTTREIGVFDEMFDMIFNAVSARDRRKGPSPSSTSSSPSASSFATPHAQTPSIGHAGTPLNDIFRTLRRHSRVRWTSAIDEELDRKKETMELFNTDYDLLEWVMQDLFGGAEQWEEEAMAGASKKVKAKGSGKGDDDDVAAAAGPNEGLINPSIYPHLIAHAMRIFRTTYSNPSLSLAVFEHAARASIPSYVFGCTARAYNELMEAKWEGWGDLEGVHTALEEMKANGVKVDGRTRVVVERVRREVGEARWKELGVSEDGQAIVDDAGNVNPLARRVWEELGEVEVMRLLHEIERLARRDKSRKPTSRPHEETWKNEPVEDDGWTFDSWDKDTKKPRGKGTSLSRDQARSRTLVDLTALDTPEGEMEFR